VTPAPAPPEPKPSAQQKGSSLKRKQPSQPVLANDVPANKAAKSSKPARKTPPLPNAPPSRQASPKISVQPIDTFKARSVTQQHFKPPQSTVQLPPAGTAKPPSVAVPPVIRPSTGAGSMFSFGAAAKVPPRSSAPQVSARLPEKPAQPVKPSATKQAAAPAATVALAGKQSMSTASQRAPDAPTAGLRLAGSLSAEIDETLAMEADSDKEAPAQQARAAAKPPCSSTAKPGPSTTPGVPAGSEAAARTETAAGDAPQKEGDDKAGSGSSSSSSSSSSSDSSSGSSSSSSSSSDSADSGKKS
jgi:hypothetical protein